MFNNKLTRDSVVEAVEKIIEAKKDDTTDVPWKSGIGVERKHTPRTDKQAMSAAHNAVGKGLKKAKSMSKEGFSFKDQLIENHKSKQFEIELIDEKEMSPAQSKKKEEIVLSMKDREKEFKAKYGKRWKEVMYATATKMAMKEETLDEKWDDDDEDDDVKRADAELKRMKAKPIHADKKTDPDKEIGKLAKKTPKEVDESVEQIDEKIKVKVSTNKPIGFKVADIGPGQKEYNVKTDKVWDDQNEKNHQKEEAEQIDELSKDTLGSYVKKSSDAADKHLKLANSAAQRSKTKADTAQYMKHSEKFGKRIGGIVTAKKKLNNEETVAEDKWTDIADGPWKKSKRTPGQAASAAANAAGKGLKGAQHKLDVAEPKGKLTGADFKKLRKEDAEQIDELSKKTLSNYMRANTKRMADPKNPDSMERKMKRHDDYFKASKKFHEESELVEGDVMHTHSVHFACPETGEWSGKMLIKADHDKEAVKTGHDMAKKHGLKLMKVSKNNVVMSDKTLGEEVIYEAKGPETDNVPFVQNANPSSNPVTPLSRAKDLAHSAMKRIKNEMLGKAGATSEEIDPNVKTTDMLRGRVKGGKKDDVGPGADGKSTKVKFTPGPK